MVTIEQILSVRQERPQLYEALRRLVDAHNQLEKDGLAGDVLTQADFTPSAGWGTAASVGSIAGAQKRAIFTVSSAGTGQAANPTVTLKFKSGLWKARPFALVMRNGGNQPSVLPTWTESTTQIVITFPGTPVAGESYTFEFSVRA